LIGGLGEPKGDVMHVNSYAAELPIELVVVSLISITESSSKSVS
jgi:hypothetical protein